MSSGEIYYPFGSITPAIVPQVIPYDLVVQEAYPGVVLAPTEPNGVYSVLREVSGCTWWVLNADFNDNTERWEQDSPTNAVLPAYALEQCQSGTLTRYVAAATVIPGNAVNWIPVWTIDANGFQTIQTQTATQAAQIAQIIDVTWNAGTSSRMNAREVNVTDTSSQANSLVDNISVDTNPVWQIDKSGTLVTGIIPFSHITGYTPPTSFTNATFNGTTTFNGPIVSNGITNSGGITNTGGFTTDSEHVTGNSQVDGNETVNGNFTTNGTATIHNLTVTGTTTSTSGTPLVNITSIGGTIAVTEPSSNTYNLEVATPTSTNYKTYVGSFQIVGPMAAGNQDVPIVTGATYTNTPPTHYYRFNVTLFAVFAASGTVTLSKSSSDTAGTAWLFFNSMANTSIWNVQANVPISISIAGSIPGFLGSAANVYLNVAWSGATAVLGGVQSNIFLDTVISPMSPT